MFNLSNKTINFWDFLQLFQTGIATIYRRALLGYIQKFFDPSFNPFNKFYLKMGVLKCFTTVFYVFG